jgi:hypothetical protein
MRNAIIFYVSWSGSPPAIFASVQSQKNHVAPLPMCVMDAKIRVWLQHLALALYFHH